VVNVALLTITNSSPTPTHQMTGLDVSDLKTPADKARGLLEAEVKELEQAGQLKNPDLRISLSKFSAKSQVRQFATATEGLSTGDRDRFIHNFWEQQNISVAWVKFQTATMLDTDIGGCSEILLWEHGSGTLSESETARVQGNSAWGSTGILVSRVRSLRISSYFGTHYDKSCVALIPISPEVVSALWAFTKSPEFVEEVRKLDQKPYVTTSVFTNLPFDLEHWTKVAQEKYPGGLPEPYSNDPTQWLFKGTVTDTTEALLVAVARLLGYRWPEQVDDGLPEDADGIVCLPAVAGELPAADRLRALLARVYGGRWSATLEQALLASVGFEGQSLEEWLRDGFFVRHCRVFHNRPFIWHVWDGRKDGFSALLNYHQLDRAKLEKLIYTYLGAYISAQEAAAKRDERGADLRLVAALELKKRLVAILHGEPPFDIFVRWKPLHQQPIGWEPDLNDGARLNIRPWVRAGVLRARFTINWNKDRGTDPKPNASGTTERLNDLHLTRQQKEEARRQAGAA
jgi:hypothetical protein